jgi:hypothetical protein
MNKLRIIIGSFLVLALIVAFSPLLTQAANPTMSQVTTGTATGDETINVPNGLSGVTIVYCSIINDGDSAHTTIDGTFTFGGVTMTEAIGGQVHNGNYWISCYYVPNYAGTGNQTMHYGNHGGFGTMQWAVWVISNSSTVSPLDAGTSANNGASANPSVSVTTSLGSDILLGAVGGSNTLTAATSQTVDQSSDTNLAVAHATAGAAGSQTMSWTMSSGSWAEGLVAIKGTANAAVVAPSIVTVSGRTVISRSTIIR